MTSLSVHTATPDLSVLDGRGLIVRTVHCLRSELSESVGLLISSRFQDLAGRPVATRDPRFNAAPDHAPCNVTSLFSLSGLPVHVTSVDSGWRVHIYAVDAQLVGSWDSRGSCWWTDFDDQRRPLALHEQEQGRAAAVIERFEYADGAFTASQRNRCGRLIRHDDPAGTRLLDDYGLAGHQIVESRQFLQALEAPDWPADTAARDALLAPDSLSATRYRYGPTGELVEHVDAHGNRRVFHFDLAGFAADLFLQPAGADRQCLVSQRHYDASGALLEQRLGNGMLLQAEFDPRDGRLGRMLARRSSGALLYDQRYGLDPVGNVLSIENCNRKVCYFRNQRINPLQTRQYDSLYRLVQASGFEVTNTALGPDLPALAPDPGDDSQLSNYTRHYQYDAANNLLEIRHVAQRGSFTRRMQVMAHSNRALPMDDGMPPDLENGFDGNGNQLWLQPGQPLSWDARNRLREGGGQRNVYDGNGSRVRKCLQWRAANVEHNHDVRYLPGLELQHKTASGERLAVLTLESQGFTCRLLHWEEGLPDGITNDYLSYGLSDHLGSGCLEVDQNAELISREMYYPFGGTAWWAARSAVEASYKSIRYSGHERDASGLYYYGARYYAPWLHRWISADPAGAVDGPNLYVFVRNNPATLVDDGGLQATWSKPRTVFGVTIQINEDRTLSEREQIRVPSAQLHWVTGQSKGFAEQLMPGMLNVPDSLYEAAPDSADSQYSILRTRFAIPESCIQSTEYLITYMVGDTRPFPYSPEARDSPGMPSRLPNVRARGWGSPINVSETEAVDELFRQRPAAKLDENTLPVTLGEGLIFASSANTKVPLEVNSIHFMAVTGVVQDTNGKTGAALLTDLVEPERNEGERLEAAHNWAPTLVQSIREARKNPTMGNLLVKNFAPGIAQPMTVTKYSPHQSADSGSSPGSPFSPDRKRSRTNEAGGGVRRSLFQ